VHRGGGGGGGGRESRGGAGGICVVNAPIVSGKVKKQLRELLRKFARAQKYNETWMLPALGSAPKEEVEEVRLFCSRVLFQP
jgi:hypothetical protein